MRHFTPPFTALVLIGLLAGCTMPGDLAKGVDPQEGRLVQRLIAESCPELVTEDQMGRVVRRRTLLPESIAVLYINDGGPDGGRVARFRFLPIEREFSYHKGYAMVKCGKMKVGGLYPDTYSHTSEILMEMGGDPRLYDATLSQTDRGKNKAELELGNKQPQKTVATHLLDVQWEGMAGPLLGILEDDGESSSGGMVIEWPESDDACTGGYLFTARTSGKWKLVCPDNLRASGTFQAGDGFVNGEGFDNEGRAITYTVKRGG